MPVYSPPLTRLRARVLFIAEQQQQQEQVSASDEQRRRQPGQTTRERRRPHPQQQRAETEESEKPEKAFLSKRAAGTIDSRPRSSHSKAESRPTLVKTAASGTQGNSGSRCKKGLRQARTGSRDSDPTAEIDRSNNDHKEEADHQQKMINNGEARPESVCTSSTASSESVSGAGGTTSDAQILTPSQGSNRGQLQDSGCGPGASSSGDGVGLCNSKGPNAVGAGVENIEGSTEMRGLTGLRLREKAVEATGDDEERVSSTGASPLQKRNRRELKLSQDEVAMAGAPQGPVYQVTVLETSEFEESSNPDEEMKAVHAAAGGGEDWADMYSAVDSTRRLAIFHAGVLSRPENMEGAVGLLFAAVGNLRSSMVRNALLGVRDMFRFLGEDVGKVDIRAMVTCTLQRMAGDKRFISQTAAQAMEAATRNGPAIAVLEAILVSIDDRNGEVSAKAAHFAEQCLGTLGVGSKAGVGMPENLEFQPLVDGLGKALGGKLAEGRTAARRGLLRSRKAMGPERFQAAVTACLPKTEAQSLLAALAVPNGNGARARGGKSSIRQHMLAARKENKGQRPVDGGKIGEAGFVIVT